MHNVRSRLSYQSQRTLTLKKTFVVEDVAHIIKLPQCIRILDSGMRSSYKVTKILFHDRCNLHLMGGSYGKITPATAEYMVPYYEVCTLETRGFRVSCLRWVL